MALKQANQESVIGKKPQPTEDEIRKHAYEILLRSEWRLGNEWTIG